MAMSSGPVLHQIVELERAEGWSIAYLPRHSDGEFFSVVNILRGIFPDTGDRLSRLILFIGR